MKEKEKKAQKIPYPDEKGKNCRKHENIFAQLTRYSASQGVSIVLFSL